MICEERRETVMRLNSLSCIYQLRFITFYIYMRNEPQETVITVSWNYMLLVHVYKWLCPDDPSVCRVEPVDPVNRFTVSFNIYGAGCQAMHT